MKQVVLEQPGRLVVSETAPPGQPRECEALVKVRRLGICGTDLHAFRGKQPFFTYPRRLGHELGVEVVEVGPNVTGLSAGDLCSVEPYLTCGQCIACRNGKTNCCTDLKCLGVHTDGGMCEFITVPANKLHSSTRLSLEQLALVETLGIGAHGVNRANVQRGEWALVIGAGPIGLAATEFAKAAGAGVVVADVNRRRLKFCQEHLGVKDVIDAAQDVFPQVETICGKELAPAVFDCTGNQGSMQMAFQYVSHGGRLVFIGLGQFDITFNDPHLHRRELTLISSRNSTGRELKTIIEMIEQGRINTDPWVTHRADFDCIVEDFPAYLKPETGCIKAMIEVA
jgi:2-desacetyl-2-hydroxyethyl bacteriochlorophyllide A dehydrogenase